MAQISQQINELIKQRNDLADNISAKGISATKTEKYNTLINKLNDIEIVNGEEIVLENTTKYNDIPSSVVSVEYPEQKNLIHYPYDAKTQTINGITFTINNDGSITANGIATGNALLLLQADLFYIPYGDYTLSGCPSGGSNSTYCLTATNNMGIAYTKYIVDNGSGNTFSSDNEKWVITIKIFSGVTVNNIVFKPQIEKGSTVTTYEPFKTYDIGVQLQSKNLIPSVNDTAYYNGSIIQGKPYIAANAKPLTSLTNINVSANRGIYAVVQLMPGKTYTLSLNGLVNNCATKALFLTVGFRSSEDTVLGTTDISSTVSSTVNATSLTFTVPNDKPYCVVGCYNYPTATGDTITINGMQVELGSTATSYTPYISDFSSSILDVSGKNLWQHTQNRYPNLVSYDATNNVYTLKATDNAGYSNPVHILPNPIPKGTTVTITVRCISGQGKSIAVGGYHYTEVRSWQCYIQLPFDTDLVDKVFTQTFTTTDIVEQFYIFHNIGDPITEDVKFTVQYELGSTSTPYEPYQGTTYTANVDGTVSNVKSIYPLTNLISDSSTTMTVSSGTYKQITPSSDKNSFTKAYQPTVDSSIDNNIKPEYIRKGVTILGVTGTYEPTTEES